MKINTVRISYVISVLSIVFLVVFWQPLLESLRILNIDDLKTVNEFLRVILSWPVVILVLCLIFFRKFSEQISSFLKNVSTVKWGTFEAQRQEGKLTEDVVAKTSADLAAQGINLSQEQWGQIENLVSELTTTRDQQGITIEKYQEALKATFERAENYEFAFLNLSLVSNTKFALLWFLSQPNKSSTKLNFSFNFQLPPQIINQTAEKEAIFNALLVNVLLTQNGEVFSISEKGEKFLRHIGMIK